MRKEKGITLVSLVVTIIILIILAGISINILLGEQGVITRAQQAKENMQIAQAEELEGLNHLYEQLDGYDVEMEEGSTGDLSDKLQELQSKFDSLQTEHNTFKSSIAIAITEKGIATSETDSANIMVENIKKLNTHTFTLVGSITTPYTATLDCSSINGYDSLTEDDFIYICKTVAGGSYSNSNASITQTISKTYESYTRIMTIVNGKSKHAYTWTTGDIYYIH